MAEKEQEKREKLEELHRQKDEELENCQRKEKEQRDMNIQLEVSLKSN